MFLNISTSAWRYFKTRIRYFLFLIMKKIISITLMISSLLGPIGCQGLWYQFLNITVDIAPNRFVIEEDHEKVSIPIVTSHPLDKNNNETEYLIIMIHGAGLNANKMFETGQQIIESLKMPKDRFWVLAPQIIEGVKLDEKRLLFWDRRWRSGGMFLSTGLNKDLPSLSSFEVIDRHHLKSIVKSSPKSQHIWLEIPEVGHEATEIFSNPRFITELKTLDF